MESAHLYQQIAQEMTLDIKEGLYEPGQKVPSVRKLSQQRCVSISTVNQAYALLEDQGYLRAKPQSGYFVKEGANDPIQAPPVSQGGQPQTVGKEIMIKQMLNSINQPSIVNFAAAIAHESLLPLRALQNHVQKAVRYQSSDVFQYLFSPGLEPLRKQIATRMREVSVKCHHNDIIITQGCSEALALCLKSSTQPGDIIAVESPCYYGFLQLAKQHGLKVIEIPTDANDGMSLDALALALKEWPIRLIAVASRYSNPIGARLSTAKQQSLYKLAQQFDCQILEDDIYGELGFKDDLKTVLKTFDVDDRVMYCSSFSKTLSPGLRIGWCLAGRHLESVKQRQMFSSFSPSTLSQYAMSSYLKTGHYDKHLRKLRDICQLNVQTMCLAIRQHFPLGTRITQPQGGFIIWLALPHNINTSELQTLALQHQINIAPGSLFSNEHEFDHYLRINCALPQDQNSRAAIKTLGGLINTLIDQNAGIKA
mgnify:CR=1 FL=1